MSIQEIEDFLSTLILDVNKDYYATQYKEHCGARYLDNTKKFEYFNIADVCFLLENDKILYFPEALKREMDKCEASEYKIDCLVCCIFVDNRDMYDWLCALKALDSLVFRHCLDYIEDCLYLKFE